MRRARQPERLAFLEGLRGLAALFVVVGHMGSMADPDHFFRGVSKAPEWLQMAMEPLRFGHVAVASFIVLSGFCLQLALFGTRAGRLVHVGRFFRRRAMRILPAYYACLAISLVVALTVTPLFPYMPFIQYLPVTVENTLAHVFLIHNWRPEWMYKINGVLWTIAVEVQLYLFFPWLTRAIDRIGRLETFAITLAIAIALLLFVPPTNKLYVWYLPLFTAGMVAAHLAHRPNLRTGARPWVGTTLALIGLAAAGYVCWFRFPIPVRDMAAGLTIAAVCYCWTVKPGGWLFELASARWVVGVGVFSYSLYLMHHPIQQLIYLVRPGWAVGTQNLFLYLLLAGLPVILVLSYLFYLGFERPFLRRRAAYAPDDDESEDRPRTIRAIGKVEWTGSAIEDTRTEAERPQ